MEKKLVEFKIGINGVFKKVRVNVSCAKKRINFDPEFHTVHDVYQECEKKAVEKLYGKGRCFIQDNSGIEGHGQIWKESRSGGYDSVTGVIFIRSNFYE